MRNVFKLVNGTTFYRIAVTACLAVLAYTGIQNSNRMNSLADTNHRIQQGMDTIQAKVDSVSIRLDSLELIHPWKYDKDFKKKMQKKLSSMISKTSFFNFVVWDPVDTAITREMTMALQAYDGPTVKINSLRRHGTKSKHCHGNAVDLELTHALVEYLLTEEGQDWLISHQLKFYIEGKPGSRKVGKYLDDTRTESYVFFNKKATGDHIHVFRNV